VRASALLALPLVLAACGGESERAAIEPSRDCFEREGATIQASSDLSAEDVLQATLASGEPVLFLFYEDEREAQRLADQGEALREAAERQGEGIPDGAYEVFRRTGNVLTLWVDPPTEEAEATVERCLVS
jgi:hypothetical protein